MNIVLFLFYVGMFYVYVGISGVMMLEVISCYSFLSMSNVVQLGLLVIARWDTFIKLSTFKQQGNVIVPSFKVSWVWLKKNKLMRASLFQNWKHLKDVTGDTTQWVGVCCFCRVAEFSFQHLHGTVHSHLEHRLKVSDTVSQQTSCPLDLTIFLPPLCWYSLNLRCTSCIVDVTFGMYYKKLYFSIMASICCKEKLLFLPIVFPSSNSSDVGM